MGGDVLLQLKVLITEERMVSEGSNRTKVVDKRGESNEKKLSYSGSFQLAGILCVMYVLLHIKSPMNSWVSMSGVKM